MELAEEGIDLGGDVEATDSKVGDDGKEKGADECLKESGEESAAKVGKKGREKPAPEEVKSKEAEGEDDDPQLFGREEGNTEAAPEESEEGDEINNIGKEGGTGRACETPAGYEPKVEQDGRGGEEDDKKE